MLHRSSPPSQALPEAETLDEKGASFPRGGICYAARMTQQRSDLRVGRRASLVGLSTLVGTAALGGVATSSEGAVPKGEALAAGGPANVGEALGAVDRNAGYEALYPVTGISERERVERAHGLAAAGEEVRALLGPLADGASFRAADGSQWQVVAAYEPRGGSLPVVLAARSALGTKVALELVRDSEDGPRAPARAAGLAAFVANGGDGNVATREQQGLAAMAFIAAIAPRANASVVARLATHAERGAAAVVPV